jgi:hypothetical protein
MLTGLVWGVKQLDHVNAGGDGAAAAGGTSQLCDEMKRLEITHVSTSQSRNSFILLKLRTKILFCVDTKLHEIYCGAATDTISNFCLSKGRLQALSL